MQFSFYPGHERGCGHPNDCPHLGGAGVGFLVQLVNTAEDSRLYLHRQLDAERQRSSELVADVIRLEQALAQAQLELRLERQNKFATIWLVHDEFAEWMLIDDYKEHVSSTLQRLGVKARAAGIHLVFAAQRPDVNVMPMQLRANLGNRLILRVDSEGTSEVSLGEKGAETLLGKGHLLAKLEGESGLVFAQVPFPPEVLVNEILNRLH